MSESARINWVVMGCSIAGHVALVGGIVGFVATRPVPPRADSGDALMFEMLPAPAARPAAAGEAALPQPARAAAPLPLPAAPAHDTHGMVAAPAPAGGAPAGERAQLVAVARPVATGLSPGGGVQAAALDAAAQGAYLRYQRLLHELIARQVRYPAEARRIGAAGLTRVAFRLDRLGHVVESWVQDSSGVAVLDGAAMDALHRADPLPPVPPMLPAPVGLSIEIDLATQPALAGARW